MLEGSCACGRIRYVIDGELVGPVGHCHCWQCRKHSGASFGTTAAIRTDSFRIVAGSEALSSWESSAGIQRHFAGCCGTPICKSRDALPDWLGLRLGTLDTDPGRMVEEHIFVDSKVPWLELRDGLPQQAGGASFPQRDEGGKP